ncbi:MAG: NAD(P)-binding domain-containing protein [Gemmatimonadetes bacterium]|nr:NAD(P)-binding domain-containing protein [Gemmatimonadota bacterium]
MRIGILGTGVVGRTLGTKLVAQGHGVRLGSRTAGNERAVAWAAEAGAGASAGTFADAAAFGEVVLNCTAGVASLDALEAAGRANLAGKVLVDVANPLDFSHGMPPTLTVCNTESLAERIQRAFPEARVVKTLNTVAAAVMVDPSLVPGEHELFLSGDDRAAKGQVAGWLTEWFGWRPERIIDLGDLSTARTTEMLVPLWLRLYQMFGTRLINFHVQRAP